jgi:hypothetical protein
MNDDACIEPLEDRLASLRAQIAELKSDRARDGDRPRARNAGRLRHPSARRTASAVRGCAEGLGSERILSEIKTCLPLFLR